MALGTRIGVKKEINYSHTQMIAIKYLLHIFLLLRIMNTPNHNKNVRSEHQMLWRSSSFDFTCLQALKLRQVIETLVFKKKKFKSNLKNLEGERVVRILHFV